MAYFWQLNFRSKSKRQNIRGIQLVTKSGWPKLSDKNSSPNHMPGWIEVGVEGGRGCSSINLSRYGLYVLTGLVYWQEERVL